MAVKSTTEIRKNDAKLSEQGDMKLPKKDDAMVPARRDPKSPKVDDEKTPIRDVRDGHRPHRTFMSSLGVGSLLSWITLLFCFEGIVQGNANGWGTIHDPFFISSTLAVAAFFIILYRLPGTLFERIVLGAQRLPLWISCVLAAVATFYLGVMLTSETIVAIILGVVVGLTFGLLFAPWLEMLREYDPRNVIIVFIAAVAMTFFVLTLCFACERLVNSIIPTVFACMLLMLSGIITATRDTKPTVVDQPSSPYDALTVRISVFAFSVSFFFQFLWVFILKFQETQFFLVFELGMGLGLSMYVICGVAIIALLVVLLTRIRKSAYLVLTLHRIIFFILVMATASVLAGNSLFLLAYILMLLGYFLAQISIWIILVRIGYLYENEMSHSYIGFTVASQFLGYAAGFAFYLSCRAWFDASSLFVAITLLVLLALACVAFLFVFTESEIKVLERFSYRERPHEITLHDKCLLVEERHGLTERETEILELLAQGRNAVSIQDMLFISYSTVKAHKNSIYKKLDIHSQQELLDFMDAFS